MERHMILRFQALRKLSRKSLEETGREVSHFTRQLSFLFDVLVRGAAVHFPSGTTTRSPDRRGRKDQSIIRLSPQTNRSDKDAPGEILNVQERR
jgi:hypothetical protein